MSAAERYRVASPQAWRRLRSLFTEGELLDVATDLACELTDSRDEAEGYARRLAYALADEDWDARKQA